MELVYALEILVGTISSTMYPLDIAIHVHQDVNSVLKTEFVNNAIQQLIYSIVANILIVWTLVLMEHLQILFIEGAVSATLHVVNVN